MKKVSKLFVLTIFSVFLFFGTNALAVNVDLQIYDATDSTSIASWKAALGGNDILLEDFSGVSTGWYESLYLSGFGTFTAGGGIGLGGSSYNAINATNSSDPYFRISDQNVYGRTGGDNFLDSADIGLLTLDLERDLTNIWFYIQDPSDQSGTLTTVTGTSVTLNFDDSDGWNANDAREDNSAMFFVGITVEDDFLNTITWDVSQQRDGYGLDDFHTTAPVPEPATMLLLGTGLIGLAGIGRKRFIKK